jgi:hypothetical protein
MLLGRLEGCREKAPVFLYHAVLRSVRRIYNDEVLSSSEYNQTLTSIGRV